MRNRVAAAPALTLVALALSACAAPGPAPTPTPTPPSRDVAAASRCLVDHSPWTIDLEAVHAEWSGVADGTRHPVTGGEVNGTATVAFTRGESPRWEFTATGVDYELYFGDGTRERTTVDASSHGGYAIPEPGDRLVLSRVTVDASTQEPSSTAPDGTATAGVEIAAPAFPWLSAGSVAFTCTEHRLVLSTPGQVPASWTLQPAG